METYLPLLLLLLVMLAVVFISIKLEEREQAAEEKKRQSKLLRLAEEAKTAGEIDAKAAIARDIEEQRSINLEKYDKALTFSTYELAEIVINLVDRNNYDKLEEVISVLSDLPHIDEVLTEASKKLSSGYKSAIEEIAGTRCQEIDYSENEVSVKLESLVESCVTIGKGAIGKKVRVSTSAIEDSSSKRPLRKTKKWKD